MSNLGVLLQIALRNLFASFLNIIIGGIILVGTLLIVVGSSVLDSLDSAMTRSVTGSVAGHVQVYSAKSKDELSLFGSFGGFPDVAAIPDYSKVKQSLSKVDNIKAIVPMGINGALITSGNTVDLALEKLRNQVNKQLRGDDSVQSRDQIASYKDHVRQIVRVLQSDYKKLGVIADKTALDPQNAQWIERAASDAFWSDFDKAPLDHLEFLENKIAPMVPDADLLYLGYVGTDLDGFRQSFDRMEVVDGQMVPQGHRGFLLSKFQYEEHFKLKTARRLDKLKEALHDEGKTIATDPDLKRLVRENKSQTREIVLQLDAIATRKAVAALQAFLKSSETDVAKLLATALDTDDANFDSRRQFFYDQIAPLVELYRVRPGDMLTIKAYTNSGFVKSVNVKVYGTFQFKGLEKSGLAGGLSLMDLMSFRDLYGYVTQDNLQEIKQLQKAAGAQFVDRSKAEDELFAGGSTVSESKGEAIDDAKALAGHDVAPKNEELIARAYSQDDIEKGVILNAAIILKDPTQLRRTMKEIEDVATRDGLELKVVSWQQAAGYLGQLVFAAKMVLYLAVFIIFVVAVVVINNAVMMATMQRVTEIGTMRAIGAQRGFVLSMILVETIVLGLGFGSLGALLGAFIVRRIGHAGIPATNDMAYFFFSGPRLFPGLGAWNLIAAFVTILIVTCISTLYPALIATRVSPVTAMQTEE